MREINEMQMDNSKTHGPACPLCGIDSPKKAPRYAKLYGHYVCRKCYFGFANRRQFAFLIDGVLLDLFFRAIERLIGIDFWTCESESGAGLYTFSYILGLLFLFKDGFNGQSPGRALMGIQVVDENTGQPIGFLASFKRNLPLLIPFAVIFVAFQLMKGHRLGDKWSKTKVVWKKYKNEALFAVQAPSPGSPK